MTAVNEAGQSEVVLDIPCIVPRPLIEKELHPPQI